jgi:hypothetical protein
MPRKPREILGSNLPSLEGRAEDGKRESTDLVVFKPPSSYRSIVNVYSLTAAESSS